MKIKVSKLELIKNLKILKKMPRGSGVISKIGEEVFFTLEENELKMMVYDGLEVFSEVKLSNAKVEKGLENLFGIDLNLLLSISSKVDKDINIELKEKFIKIESGRSCFNIYRSGLEGVWNNHDMPSIETRCIDFTANSSKLKKLLESVIVSASEDKKDKMLNSIKVKLYENKIEVCSMDGYRASIGFYNVNEWICRESEVVEFLLMKESIPVVIEMLNTSDVVRIMISGDNAVLFEVGNMSVIIRGRSIGKYPDVKKLLETEGERTININKKEWFKAISEISNLGANIVKLDSEKNTGKVTISGENDLVRDYEASGEVDVLFGGDIEGGIKMLFRNKLLIDGIKSIDSEKINIRIGGPNNFITIRPDKDIEYVNIVLPCRIL